MIDGRSAENPMRITKFAAQAKMSRSHTRTYEGMAPGSIERSRSVPVAGALLGLQRGDRFGGAAEDVGHRPALKAGVRVDLGTVVNLVLEDHHEQAPAGERPERVDHLDLSSEPVRRGVLQPRDEPSGGCLEPGKPRPLVRAVDLGQRRDPALAAVRAGEVHARAADVAHDVADAPAGGLAD